MAISMYAVRAEQCELMFSPSMSRDDFLSYMKNDGLEEIDCLKLSGNWFINFNDDRTKVHAIQASYYIKSKFMLLEVMLLCLCRSQQ